jgi:hypothetical protein
MGAQARSPRWEEGIRRLQELGGGGGGADGHAARWGIRGNELEGGERFKTGGKPGAGKCLGQKNAYVGRGEGWEPSSRDGPIPHRQIPQDSVVPRRAR